ncbi:peptidoglycan/xylan/chitin deacetylase (PgdA/CDA1 family) [Mycobacterium sp. MAA66]|jgi:peptidoglycan/xylan/chitin deacetylase (PgdA/CDA1 family)
MTNRYPTLHSPLSSGSALSRRRFMVALSASVVAGVGLARCAVDSSPVQAAAPPIKPKPAGMQLPLPGGGALSSLPDSAGNTLALTLDDGVNADVIRGYTQLAKDTGLRLTYFVNGKYRSWTENRDLLRPLVESGQIQLGNHTWSHPDLATLPKDQVVDQLERNHKFLQSTFGVDARPYFRPPYGSHNPVVDSIATELGYSMPTMWSGSLEDQNIVAEDYIVKMATKYFTAQTVVIGHLNHLPVTHVYGQLVDLLRDRELRTVTLNDVFRKPGQLPA